MPFFRCYSKSHQRPQRLIDFDQMQKCDFLNAKSFHCGIVNMIRMSILNMNR